MTADDAENEEAKRLKPKRDALRELWIKSGNLCAFPNCPNLLMNPKGDFIGEVCHIEAAKEGGERFRESMTDEERRAYSNLILLCHAHHVETEDVVEYTVPALQKMKADHDARFSEADRAIWTAYRDWSTAVKPTSATTLARLSTVLDWPSEEDFTMELDGVRKISAALKLLPPMSRSLLTALLRRAWTVRETGAVQMGRLMSRFDIAIAYDDVKESLQLSTGKLSAFADQLERFRLGGADLISFDNGDIPAFFVNDAAGGWPFWSQLLRYCEIENIDLAVFTEGLDFARLDA